MKKTSYVPPSAQTIDTLIARVKFDAAGLIAAIAQDASAPHDVLMLAWMNKDALTETLLSGRVCYYSRSRKALWRKGETSGQHQHLVSAALDCDLDAILLKVTQDGVACHTGRRSCFYFGVRPTGIVELTRPVLDPAHLYGGAPLPKSAAKP